MVDQSTHPTCIESNHLLRNGDIILFRGTGNIELNMARNLLKLLWDPRLVSFVKMLGLQLSKAQDAVVSGK